MKNIRFEKVLMSHEIIGNREIPINTIVMYFYDIIVLCDDFHHSRKDKLKVRIYSKGKWYNARIKNQYSEMLWDYYRKTQKRPKRDGKNYAQMMRHDRYHKKSGGGSIIYNGSITDYECTKNPMHDFRRVYI